MHSTASVEWLRVLAISTRIGATGRLWQYSCAMGSSAWTATVRLCHALLAPPCCDPLPSNPVPCIRSVSLTRAPANLGAAGGFARLLLQQPIAGRSETVGAWISQRLDAVARERRLSSRQHVAYSGEIPGMAPILHAVQATFGRLAGDYLGSDAVLSDYSVFRLPPRLDLEHCSCHPPARPAARSPTRICKRVGIVLATSQPCRAAYCPDSSAMRSQCAGADPAGYYHHDRCGHRLKAYLLLTRVTEGSYDRTRPTS
jgi:hypothetical protein